MKKTVVPRVLVSGLVAAALGAGLLAGAGPEGSRPPLVLKAERYGLDLRFDFEAEKLFAECRLDVRNPSGGPVDRIPLILYRLLKVTSVTDDGGAPLPVSQRIEACEDWDRLQLNSIEIGPFAPIPAGGRRAVFIKYEGYLAGYEDSGMLYVKDRIRRDFTIVRMDCLAYPQIGIPDWEANQAAGMPSFDYILKVTVPDGLVAANGGELVESVSKGGLTSYTYRNIKPAWRMDAAVGSYRIVEDKAENLKIFHFPEDAAGAEAVMKGALAAKKLFTGWFGRLRDDRGFTVIEVPEGFGSQSDVTSILQTRDAFKDKSQMTQVYHEVSHLWDTRPLDPSPCRLESEGIAMLLQYAAKEEIEGDPGAVDGGAERLRQRFRKACEADAKAVSTPIIDYGVKGLTDLSYNKGMIYFYLLYKGAGEQAFLNALGRTRARYAETGASTMGFLACLGAFLGRDLSKINGDWISGAASSEALLSEASLADLVKRYFR